MSVPHFRFSDDNTSAENNSADNTALECYVDHFGSFSISDSGVVHHYHVTGLHCQETQEEHAVLVDHFIIKKI